MDMYPDEPRHDLEKYCFSSAFLPKVLKRLGFHVDGPDYPNDNAFAAAPQLRLARRIAGVSIDWALGHVFSEIMHARTALGHDEL
jgi:hypothetical protein